LRFEIEAAFSPGTAQHAHGQCHGARASGNFLTARPVGIMDGVDFQHQRLRAQGRWRRPSGARSTSGAMVLLSPFGFSPTGEAFNLTMEDVASQRAIALQADKLIFLTEVPGMHENRGRPRQAPSTPSWPWPTPSGCWRRCPPPTLPTDTAFYLQHCVKACEGGVERSHILPFSTDGALLLEVYTHDGIGTMVVDEKAREPARGHAATMWAASCS
jgi:amino-acid N-acetyltransferase